MSQTRHTENGSLALKAGAVYVKDGLTKPVYLMGEDELNEFAKLTEVRRANQDAFNQLNRLLSGVAA